MLQTLTSMFINQNQELSQNHLNSAPQKIIVWTTLALGTMIAGIVPPITSCPCSSSLLQAIFGAPLQCEMDYSSTADKYQSKMALL
jgi:hypothetical protein